MVSDRCRKAEMDAEKLLLKLLKGNRGKPLRFSDIERNRNGVSSDALRRAVWTLVERGDVAFTSDRRLVLGTKQAVPAAIGA